MKSPLRVFSSLGLSMLISGCTAGKVQYVKPGFSAPDFIAVLPPENKSNDLTAPRAVAGAVASALIGMGYFPILTPVQEDILHRAGLTDGGQIRAFKLSDLAKKLGTDGVALTSIEDFRKVTTGLYNRTNVEATVALHDSSGDKLWEVNSKFTEQKINLSVESALQAATSELAGDMIGKIFKTHLVLESQVMAGQLVSTGIRNQPSLAYPGPAGPVAAPAGAEADGLK